jgi:predicted phage terminase large subunit-like protein
METSDNRDFSIPRPLLWQQSFLAKERALDPRLIVLCLGRRAGKTFGVLLWLLLNRLGLLNGYPVAWLGPSDKVIAESRSWIKAWISPLIVGPSPGDLGFRLVNNAVIDWWSAAPGAKQPVRSRGYSCIAIDEAAFVPNLRQLVDASIRPALALAQGKLCSAGTPFGRNDFYWFFEEARKSGLALHAGSAINPNMRASELEKLRRNTEPLTYAQEYEAAWITREGALLKREQIRYCAPGPIETFKTLVFGVDFALSTKQSADFSALVVAGVDADDRHIILHAARWRSDWPTTFAKVLNYYEAWKPHLIMTEIVNFSELTVREMLDAGLPVNAIKPSTDKMTRFGPIHLRYSLGEVWHAESLMGSEFEAEMLSFPVAGAGSHDDQVDACVLALGALDRKIRSGWATGDASGESFRGLPHERAKKRIWTADACFEIVNGRIQKFNYDGTKRIY